MPNIITIIPQEFKKDAPYPRGYIMHLDPASKFTL